MDNPSRRHDPEVVALSAQFRVLTRKARDLVDEIDATVLLLNDYRKRHPEFPDEETEEM